MRLYAACIFFWLKRGLLADLLPNPIGAIGAMYGSIVGPSDEERTFAESAAPYVAEFVGTFFLVFTIALNTVVITSSAANGVMLMVLVYVFGPISGGHLNPAVSMACGLVGRMPWPQVIAYCLLQVSAGLLAGMACYEVFQVPMGVAPIAPFGFWDAAFLEALYTGMLCFVVLNVAVSRMANSSKRFQQ